MRRKIKYCPKCGGTRVLLDGTPCDCIMTESELYEGLDCLDIPETYRSVKFNPLLLRSDLGEAYRNTMKLYYDQLTAMRWKCANLALCSPAQSGKSILAYSVNAALFRREIEVFPVLDIMEIRRVMLDLEYNRSQSLGIDNPMSLLTAPYVFAYMTPSTDYAVYDAAATLIYRRVRRGNSTILLYRGSWNQLVYNDSKGSLKNMKGNGSLNTIQVSSWDMESKEDKQV